MAIYCTACGTRHENERLIVCTECAKPLPRAPKSNSEPAAVVHERKDPARERPSRSAQMPRNIDGYEIIQPLGHGGMGSVYLAYEPLLDRQVALKLLARDEDDAARARNTARFLSEAALTGKLGHAGIIPIYHIGFDHTHGYYYTMRYVKGRSLAEIIKLLMKKDAVAKETYTLNRLLQIFLRVCEAVGFAHSHGIVHRDIKPANVMVADFGEVLTLDWGLAKDMRAGRALEVGGGEIEFKLAELRRKRSSATQLFLSKEQEPGKSTLQRLKNMQPGSIIDASTKHNQILGTPGYLSPEQGEGKTDVTAASDVYSLGVTLYQILTLVEPVEAADTMEMIRKTVHGEIVPIDRRPEAMDLPRALCELVTRSLALKPEERFKDAKEMAEELTLYLDGKATWKTIAREQYSDGTLSDQWRAVNGSAASTADGLVLEPGARLACTRLALGDLRCSYEFWAESDDARWSFTIAIMEVLANQNIEPRYEIRLGVEERPFVELLRNGRRVQRRFDVRFQSSQRYTMQLELEHDRLRMKIEDRKLIDYKEVFPQTGGAIELFSPTDRIVVDRFQLQSRGAPLNLSFMVLPDRLYRTMRFDDARELYRQLAESHPDREEGLLALYKCGLSSAALNDLPAAINEFTRLEGTMYDHCGALGLAQIGIRDGRIDWAWEALKNGFKRHKSQSIRSEIWFALLNVIEHIPSDCTVEKIKRYEELLSELEPEPQEAGQITFDLLDLILQAQGFEALREKAIDFLTRFEANVHVLSETILALSRIGIDEASIPAVSTALQKCIAQRGSDANMARFYILHAEILIAQGELEPAFLQLGDAITMSGPATTEGYWARGWQFLIHYLSGQYQPTLAGVSEILERYKRAKSTQFGYFRLLEALAYLAQERRDESMDAFRRAIEIDCIWGRAAAYFLSGQQTAALIEQSRNSGSNQIVEALFLIGEAHYFSGNLDLASTYYRACLHPSRDRAMITRFAKLRLTDLATET
jgi:serine/threonine protein kinase/tetratricopeptide (TPR) repeat protein